MRWVATPYSATLRKDFTRDALHFYMQNFESMADVAGKSATPRSAHLLYIEI
jgi:hypothetical protein